MDAAKDAVFVDSQALPADTPVVKGYDFKNGIDIDALLDTYFVSGFQATNFGKAVDEINAMLDWRMHPATKPGDMSPEECNALRTRIFLGYTSNLVNSGLRDTFRFLAQRRQVQVIVTTGGGVEDDFIKCFGDSILAPTTPTPAPVGMDNTYAHYGNIRVPREAQKKFEEWLYPLIEEAVQKQVLPQPGDPLLKTFVWTPSKFIDFLGSKINREESIYHWCHKNNIPVYCPALTDGIIGRVLCKHSRNQTDRSKRLVLDIVEDIKGMNQQATKARHTGMIILGGGLVKHHICNANLMRNGADHSVFINTGQEFDGSDAGARPDEAKSWGKIKLDAKPAKIYSDATLVFPLLVKKTFYQHATNLELADRGN